MSKTGTFCSTPNEGLGETVNRSQGAPGLSPRQAPSPSRCRGVTSASDSMKKSCAGRKTCPYFDSLHAVLSDCPDVTPAINAHLGLEEVDVEADVGVDIEGDVNEQKKNGIVFKVILLQGTNHKIQNLQNGCKQWEFVILHNHICCWSLQDLQKGCGLSRNQGLYGHTSMR